MSTSMHLFLHESQVRIAVEASLIFMTDVTFSFCLCLIAIVKLVIVSKFTAWNGGDASVFKHK